MSTINLQSIPPCILRLISEEAIGDFVYGVDAADDISLSDVKRAAESCAANHSDTVTIVSEVFRQNSNGRLLFFTEHMGRFSRMIETSFGVGTESEACGLACKAVSRLMTHDLSKGICDGRVIKLISWAVSQGEKKSTKIVSLVFFKQFIAVPEEVARFGAVVSLIFCEDKTDASLEKAKKIAAEHRDKLGVVDSLVIDKQSGVVFDAIASQFICVAEDSIVVPMDYTPSSSDISNILGMQVSLIGLRTSCDNLKIEFRSLDLTLKHLAMADAVALLSDDHDVLPISVIITDKTECKGTMSDFDPFIAEKDGFKVLPKNVDETSTKLISTVNTYINTKGFQLGDDASEVCVQQ